MKIIRKFLPIILCLTLLAVLSCCGRVQSSKRRLNSEAESVTATQCDEEILYGTGDKNKMIKIVSSGMLEMYLDEKTMSVCVYDAGADKLYHALPREKGDEVPSSLTLTVYCGGREYVLSSQKDSLAFSCAKYKKTKSGVLITYTFRQSLEGGGKVDISVPVSYALSDGMLTVSVECSDIDNKGDTVIGYVELLPFFDADVSVQKGDYIVLPDGCGEVMYLDEGDKRQVRFSTYGSDAALPGEDSPSASIACFGRKKGESAYVCTVTEGEALCDINGARAGDSSDYNRAWAGFKITGTDKNDGYLYVSDNSYEGNITLNYRFLSGDNSDYIAMAGAVRELLIRCGNLRENPSDKNSDYPFNLTLVMSRAAQDDSVQCLTDFNSAYELISYLKAKGFSNINTVLQGIYENGSVAILKSLGSEKELDTLLKLQDDGTVSFYSDYSLYGGGYSAVGIRGDKLDLSAHKRINSSLNELITDIRGQSFKGVYIGDAGKTLYSDYSNKTYSNRENVKNSLFKIFGSIFASKGLAVNYGNLYSVKYASLILNLPSTSSMKNEPGFESVPFIQAILHGLVSYSHEGINLSDKSREQILKSVEYGALLHYNWYCTDLGEEDDSMYYMTNVGEAKAYYDKMKSDLSHLSERRITAHEKVADEVYLTRFGEDVGVYVNYSDKAVSVDGITVDSKSYAVLQ